jgi:hypothetical protein
MNEQEIKRLLELASIIIARHPNVYNQNTLCFHIDDMVIPYEDAVLIVEEAERRTELDLPGIPFSVTKSMLNKS